MPGAEQPRHHVEVATHGSHRLPGGRDDAGVLHREVRPVGQARDIQEDPVGHGASLRGRVHHLEEFRMKVRGRAGEERVRPNGPGFALDVGDGSSRFGDEQGARPRVERRAGEQHIRRHPAGGDVRRRQRAAEVADVPAIGSDGVMREPRGMLAARAACRARLNDDGLALPAGAQLTVTVVADRPCSMATLGDQDLADRCIPDDGEADLVVLHQRQVDAVQGDPGSEVAGAADGIEEPVRGAVGRSLAAALFAHDRMRRCTLDDASDRILDGHVGRRHEIAATFGGDLVRARSAQGEVEPTTDGDDGDLGRRLNAFDGGFVGQRFRAYRWTGHGSRGASTRSSSPGECPHSVR